MKIVIGSDHGGIHLKEVLKQHLALAQSGGEVPWMGALRCILQRKQQLVAVFQAL